MAIGILNQTNVTLANITKVGNFTDPVDFFINVNNQVYGGVLYFFVLIILWFIIFRVLQESNDQVINNGMFAGAAVSLIAMLIRGVFRVTNGEYLGLITDRQMWVFILTTSVLAWAAWATKEK